MRVLRRISLAAASLFALALAGGAHWTLEAADHWPPIRGWSITPFDMRPIAGVGQVSGLRFGLPATLSPSSDVVLVGKRRRDKELP